MINQNELARKIAAAEGGKRNLNIGDIKEVLKISLNLLAKENETEVLKLLQRHRN